MNFAISLFKSVGDTRPQQVSRTWAQLCGKFATPQVREDKDGLLFSPARLAGNRRLQSNVIDLSMLVLEIDGAWRCNCCGQVGPHVMFVSNRVKNDAGRVDRSPRCPSCLKSKCSQCYRKSPKPHTEISLSRIEFTFESVIDGMRRVFPQTAFAIYSTHSHQRVTAVECGKDVLCRPGCNGCGAVFGHEVPEGCYRLVVPLATPVPMADFPSLWLCAVNALHKSDVVADPQAKDPNRIFYTPVKFSNESPYNYHIEAGAWFDWQTAGSAAVPSATTRVSAQPTMAGDFATHEDRNEELGRRIAARGKQNTRGHFDAKCLAHNGRGDTSLVYFPDSGAIQCNAGCDYYELLKAEGLSDNPLPSRERLALDAAREQPRRLALERTRPLTVADLHAVYALMLAHFFELSPDHERLIREHWNENPFGDELIPYWGEEEKPDRPVKMCSMPTSVQRAVAVRKLSEWFDLTGVPGFYREVSPLPQAPGRAAEMERWQTKEFGPWRLHLPYKSGLLVPYGSPSVGLGYIVGIRIFKSTRDKHPTLLTSRELPGGAAAVPYREAVAA